MTHWEYWTTAAVILVIYAQHRRITIRKLALELASTLRPHNIFETEKTLIARAAEYEEYIRNGKMVEAKKEEVKQE